MDANIKLWEKHEKTDPSKTKKAKVNGGHNITAIDAYSQIKEATEEWGPFGSQWGVKEAKWNVQRLPSQLGDGEYCMGEFFGLLYYPEGEVPITSTISVVSVRRPREGAPYESVDDEWTKKAFTNALTKGLSYLGFNADIFMGLFDDNKYLAERRREESLKNQHPQAPDNRVMEWITQWTTEANKIEDDGHRAKLIKGIKDAADNQDRNLASRVEKEIQEALALPTY